jgi:23S rRNA (uracil1939-C5)-methyltransferase
MKLQIEKCVYGGAGLARAEGKAIFVPFTLPGETVEAHITEDKRSFANAELDVVLEPSKARTAPSCEYFGPCGGCQYQHATYAQQVALKVSILQETLERARLTLLPEIVPVFAEPLAYRNRVRLHIQREPFALCYKWRASHANLPVSHCPISAPILERAIEVVTRIGGEFIREFDEIEFSTNENEGELLVTLWVRHSGRDLSSSLQKFCEAMQQELPNLTGAAVLLMKGMKEAEWGKQSLKYRAGGQAYQVSIGSFFQVNRFLIDRLVELVAADRSGKLAWDLYAGVGLFSRALSQRFEKVIAVEAAPTSYGDLRQNLSIGPHKTVRGSTMDFLRQQRGATPDLVVVDPPRSGLGAEVVAMLTKVSPQNIVYVSCDPATLSRDLHGLVESGYHLRTMHMVDLFPQTFHLESVTVLSLG